MSGGVCLRCNKNRSPLWKAFCQQCDQIVTGNLRLWARGSGSRWERANMDEAMILEEKATRQTRGQ